MTKDLDTKQDKEGFESQRCLPGSQHCALPRSKHHQVQHITCLYVKMSLGRSSCTEDSEELGQISQVSKSQ